MPAMLVMEFSSTLARPIRKERWEGWFRLGERSRRTCAMR